MATQERRRRKQYRDVYVVTYHGHYDNFDYVVCPSCGEDITSDDAKQVIYAGSSGIVTAIKAVCQYCDAKVDIAFNRAAK